MPQSIVATCPAGSGAGTWTDLVNTVQINAGDAIWFDIKNNATGTSAPIVSALILLESTIS